MSFSYTWSYCSRSYISTTDDLTGGAVEVDASSHLLLRGNA
jgi:hypothetical protein